MNDWFGKNNDLFYIAVAVVMKAVWNPDCDSWKETFKHTIVSVCLSLLALQTFYDWDIDTKYKLVLIVTCACFSHLVLNGFMSFVKNLFKEGAIFERLNPFKERPK